MSCTEKVRGAGSFFPTKNKIAISATVQNFQRGRVFCLDTPTVMLVNKVLIILVLWKIGSL